MTDDILWIDFETWSSIDIKKQGGHTYAHDDSTNTICMGFALNDEDVQLWSPNKILPQRILDAVEAGCLVYCHNAAFDYRIWNAIQTEYFDWPELALDQMVDTMALCGVYSLPLSLKDAGEAMNITMPKQKNGTALIKKLCTPDKKGNQPSPLDRLYAQDFAEFFKYCIRDVEAMREVIQALPKQTLIQQEHDIWKLTYNFNTEGLPVAYEEVCSIKNYLDKYLKIAMSEVYVVSGGAFSTINQIAKMKVWCAEQGYPIENTQAPTIIEALNDPKIPDNVAKMLKLRQKLGGTATAKFKKVMALAAPGKLDSYWVYDNLVYHGAGPGRWTGRGFQMHNLPRASVKDPELAISWFVDAKPDIEDPIGTAKALVRPIIKAPEGYTLMVSDYSSIENRVLAWLAMDEQTLEDFANDIDQYVTMAAARYGFSYSEIKEGCAAEDKVFQGMRQMGKVIILGCGYQMGADTFVKTAKLQFGMVVAEEEAKEAVNAYRKKYHLIKTLWNELKLAASRAVITGKKQTYGRITFGTATVNNTRWLAMLLPSGKCIYYKNPAVEQKHIPKYEHMGPVPTVTHEGRNPYTRKWGRLALTPGRITENATQGTAREIMGRGMLNVQERMPMVRQIGTVHDESLSYVPEALATPELLEEFNFNLCDIPFAEGCPIAAEGYLSKRYKKG